ncbi:alpha/beta fold hydrolase [Paraglaciecola sp. MB-3u-78]|uniref:alpha/beta fold hydrolase n=1 Tax=Paraglaciecola sp. MB-3u-78 TaxID=2058332 RepID=UPI000C3457AA|nr:alpha/beta hydrolase [Paraglaciecola sp. MB-3u-78]PKG97359.1 alpha/beta hydrolase [Paraglaciecola sp. MB-3u-78]
MNQLTFDNYQKHADFSELCDHRIAHWQSLNFHQDPNKDVILFIHGFPSAAWDWHFQWKHLAGQYRLLSLDLLGFGLSDKPTEHQYSLLEQADIVQALLSKLGVKQYHILAHDYGDSVAQELLSRQEAIDNAAKIQSICFLNGGLFASHHRPLFTQKLLKSRFGGLASHFMNKASLSRGFNKIFAANSQPNTHEIDTLWQLLEHNNGKRVLPKLLSYLDERKQHGKRWVESMISTLVPLYFINGVHDPISGQHMLDYYIDIIPHPRTTALDVGHYPQLEAPEKVLSLYQTFLTEIKG